MGSVSVSSCRCCIFVSCVHPVAVLNAAFCMTCSLLRIMSEVLSSFRSLRAGSQVFALLMMFLCVILHPISSGKSLQLLCIFSFGMLCLSAISMMFVKIPLVVCLVWSELLMIYTISCSLWSSVYEYQRVECAFTSPVRTVCDLFVM